MNNKITGSFIAELRKEKELTQKQLADILHITDKAVSKWEQGISAPDTSLLLPLSKTLGVSVVELMNGRRLNDVTIDDVENALTVSIKKYQSEKNYLRKKRNKITCTVLIIIILVCCFLSAHIQVSRYTQINQHISFIEGKITVNELIDIRNSFYESNGSIHVKDYISFFEDTEAASEILCEYPDFIAINHSGRNQLKKSLRSAYDSTAESINKTTHISYSHITDNIVYFSTENANKFTQALDKAINDYQTLLDMLEEMWNKYEKKPIIRIYLYFS